MFLQNRYVRTDLKYLANKADAVSYDLRKVAEHVIGENASLLIGARQYMYNKRRLSVAPIFHWRWFVLTLVCRCCIIYVYNAGLSLLYI